jgi:hypothetical protein
VSSQLFNNDRLITAAGEVDGAFIAKSAKARANSLYGVDVTAADIAYWTERLTGMAQMLADQHRWDRVLKLARAA